jgi:hypothetical protein
LKNNNNNNNNASRLNTLFLIVRDILSFKSVYDCIRIFKRTVRNFKLFVIVELWMLNQLFIIFQRYSKNVKPTWLLIYSLPNFNRVYVHYMKYNKYFSSCTYVRMLLILFKHLVYYNCVMYSYSIGIYWIMFLVNVWLFNTYIIYLVFLVFTHMKCNKKSFNIE